ncbi:MAG: polyprenyl synthetase family protein [Sandaracinaceae bacterium]|nr:polyprenyl synthetase family protein [Sandaracinaceae bacterium]
MTTRLEGRAALLDREGHLHESAPTERTDGPRGQWLRAVRERVDGELGAFFAAKRELTRRIGGDTTVLVDAIAALTMRGGKRLRPAVLFAAYRAVARGDEEPAALVRLACALELLQSYLLIHDDWMDRDDERRGGPAVHAALRAQVGDAHLGDALAILAGDLASAYAWELMVEACASLPCAPALTAAFVRMHQEVVLGQELDLVATRDVSRMQKLKTGSYTVEGPLRMGAILGGASAVELERLEAFGTPLGEAFQVRDDLLGAFGDPAKTGKPRGNDLRAGKRTVLVLECERASLPEERALLASVLGRAQASDTEVHAVLAMLERTGVRARVEDRLRHLLDQARGALAGNTLVPRGRTMLLELVDALTLA